MTRLNDFLWRHIWWRLQILRTWEEHPRHSDPPCMTTSFNCPCDTLFNFGITMTLKYLTPVPSERLGKTLTGNPNLPVSDPKDRASCQTLRSGHRIPTLTLPYRFFQSKPVLAPTPGCPDPNHHLPVSDPKGRASCPTLRSGHRIPTLTLPYHFFHSIPAFTERIRTK